MNKVEKRKIVLLGCEGLGKLMPLLDNLLNIFLLIL